MSGKVGKMVSLVLRALALAMGVAVIVLHILGAADERRRHLSPDDDAGRPVAHSDRQTGFQHPV